MFVEEVISKPHFVEGRKFIDRTIKSKFNKGEVQITTTYMDDKPLVKQYIFKGNNILKHYWKNMRNMVVQNGKLDILG